jgi:hypothetical protein
MKLSLNTSDAGRGRPTERGRNGFDGIESWWGGVPGSELP